MTVLVHKGTELLGAFHVSTPSRQTEDFVKKFKGEKLLLDPTWLYPVTVSISMPHRVRT